MNFFPKQILVLFIFLLGLFSSLNSFADGSKDLFPSGATGNRAFLFSSAQSTVRYPASWPFHTPGTHYVYVKQGERLAVSSSAMGVGTAAIRVISPTGTVTTYNTAVGKINNRAEELAGPQIPGGSVTNRYTPNITTAATAANEGIWIVEFLPPSDPTDVNTQNTNVPDMSANASWVSSDQPNTNMILAWDVSVLNAASTDWQPGRTYVNVFNMSLAFPATLTVNTKGFNSSVYVLTKDGVVYHVNNNGQNGVGFTYFVNNKGFIDPLTGTSSYKSLNTSTYAEISSKTHDPRKLDDPIASPGNLTHKIFYTKPSPDFVGVLSANIWDLSKSLQTTTWLKKVRETPKMTGLSFVGFEGTTGQVGSKGAKISFTSNVDGTYKINIPIPSRGAEAAGIRNRILTGKCIPGVNTIIWDGKDGLNEALLPGLSISNMSTQLFGAEVHFPFIDVEVNQNGIIIQQLKDITYDAYSPVRDTVYWDDKTITTTVATGSSNPLSYDNTTNGVSSIANGHKWGIFQGTPNQWGDNRSIDTWSYVPGELSEVENIDVVIMSGDLEVSSLTKSPAGAQVVSIGNNLTYSATIRNTGPDGYTGSKAATFFFHVPRGVTINPAAVTFGSATNGAALSGVGVFELVSSSLSPVSVYRVKVSMPLNSSGVFTIPVTVTGAVPTRHVNVWASILRSNDISDPNANNVNTAIPNPVDAFQEANGIYKLVTDLSLNTDINANADFDNLRGSIAGTTLPSSALYTNNIRYNNEVQMYADVEVLKVAVKSPPIAGTSTATFTITAKNNGLSTANNVIITDVLNAAYTYANHSINKGNANIAAGNVTWTIPSLLSGETAKMTINATFTTASPPDNTAIITADEFDPLTSNNTSTVSLPVTTTPVVDLQLTKTVDQAAPAIGGVVNFTITLSRVSGSDVTDVVVNDLLPSGYLYRSYSASQGAYNSSTGIWTVGVVNSAAAKTLTIEAFVKAPSSPGEYLNTATISSMTGATDTNPGNNTADAVVTPTVVDIAITKTVNNAAPDVGTQVTFKLTVNNNGPSNATGVVVYDKLPNGYTYVSDNSGGTYNPASGLWTINNLNNGNSISLDIVVTVNQTGQYLNTALVSTTSQESNYNNNAAKALVTPNCTVRNVSPKVN